MSQVSSFISEGLSGPWSVFCHLALVPLKNDGWKMDFVARPIFRGRAVELRECIPWLGLYWLYHGKSSLNHHCEGYCLNYTYTGLWGYNPSFGRCLGNPITLFVSSWGFLTYCKHLKRIQVKYFIIRKMWLQGNGLKKPRSCMEFARANWWVATLDLFIYFIFSGYQGPAHALHWDGLSCTRGGQRSQPPMRCIMLWATWKKTASEVIIPMWLIFFQKGWNHQLLQW